MTSRTSVATLLESLKISTSSIGHCPRRSVSTVAQRQRKHNDPYALAQAQARKAANQSRQAVLREERGKALGDPVHGIETPFLRSFDTALPLHPESAPHSYPPTQSSRLTPNTIHASSTTEHLNHFVSAPGLEDSIAHSQELSQSPSTDTSLKRAPREQDAFEAHDGRKQAAAREALTRITAVDNANSQDRMRINVQRCIETFGRHNTDNTLRPKPVVTPSEMDGTDHSQEGAQNIIQRAGADTGSSEVQIAILTAKIRTLAQFLQSRGRKDKMNKRNLRLFVHKRQKLLRYLRRKERGGERWQHLIQTLGLTEGTWKGEISL
ncbi:MAG: hypothetical protein Q9159_003154 [Coniocarpon cinnabarinum]